MLSDQVRLYALTGSASDPALDTEFNAASTGSTGLQNRPLYANIREPLPLEQVPQKVFSEVMRDVDLFVGVTSIGADPSWQPGDETDRRLQDYWGSYSFGPLSESAKVRADLLARLLPKLAIGKVSRLEGKFLIVEGKIRTYKIRLGSGNILMEPNDQYLCIVPGRGKDKSEILLPFVGDQMLSVVLSKAIMLANDVFIEDTTIVSQIKR